MTAAPVLVSWSSGKDSAWALHTLRQQGVEVRGLFTTVTSAFGRVSIHSTPVWVLERQAEAVGLPLYRIPIPYPCSNVEYEAAVARFLDEVRSLPPGLGARHLAFGDLFLEDIRRYRERQLQGSGFTALFPVWGSDTSRLARRMLASGLRAIVTAVNPSQLSPEFAGRWFDEDFLADLPEGTDPLGENGEFHTCVVAGPMFAAPIPAVPGPVARRSIEGADGSNSAAGPYAYADVLPQQRGS